MFIAKYLVAYYCLLLLRKHLSLPSQVPAWVLFTLIVRVFPCSPDSNVSTGQLRTFNKLQKSGESYGTYSWVKCQVIWDEWSASYEDTLSCIYVKKVCTLAWRAGWERWNWWFHKIVSYLCCFEFEDGNHPFVSRLKGVLWIYVVTMHSMHIYQKNFVWKKKKLCHSLWVHMSTEQRAIAFNVSLHDLVFYCQIKLNPTCIWIVLFFWKIERLKIQFKNFTMTRAWDWWKLIWFNIISFFSAV